MINQPYKKVFMMDFSISNPQLVGKIQLLQIKRDCLISTEACVLLDYGLLTWVRYFPLTGKWMVEMMCRDKNMDYEYPIPSDKSFFDTYDLAEFEMLAWYEAKRHIANDAQAQYNLSYGTTHYKIL